VCYRYTVKPVYKGHSRVAENVPVYKGFNYIHYSLLGKISLPFIDSDLLLKKSTLLDRFDYISEYKRRLLI
jgi:hypothetical protein